METIMHMVLKSIKIMIMALVMEVIQVIAATVAIQAIVATVAIQARAVTVAIQARAAIAQAKVLAIMIIM